MQSISNDDELPHQISVGTAGEGGSWDTRPTAYISINRLIQIVRVTVYRLLKRLQLMLQVGLPRRLSNTHTRPRTYIQYTYGTPALLHTRQQSFLSQEGTQQGDPFEMLLFSLVAQPLVLYIQATFSATP